jgi:hypothetical protein
MVSELFFTDPVSSVTVWNLPLLNYLFDEVTIREVLKINFSSLSERKFIWTICKWIVLYKVSPQVD